MSLAGVSVEYYKRLERGNAGGVSDGVLEALAGALRLESSPVCRAFATYDQVNSSSHLVGAGLELPVGARVTLRARDRFQSGVLDTRVVDPGGDVLDLGPLGVVGLGH